MKGAAQFGLLDDDYVPKDSFEAYRRIIEAGSDDMAAS